MGNTQCKPYFYESEARSIAALNEVFGDVELTAAEMRTLVWLVGWEDSMTANLLSAIRKVTVVEIKRMGQPHRP